MRFSKVKWFLCVLGICLLYWLIDSAWSYYSFELNFRSLIFSEPPTLTDTLLLRTHPHHVVYRLTLTVLIIAGGWLMYKYVYTIKSSEKRAIASEERFRSFSEQSLVGIYQFKNGIFTYVNPQFAEIIGYSVEECLDGMHYKRLVHPEDLAMVSEQIRLRTAGETPSVRYEFRGIKKDGQVVHLEIYGSSIRQHGEILVTGTMLDITDRKLAEQALVESEQKFRQLAENIDEVFWLGATDWSKIHYVSPAFERIWGISRQELYQNAHAWVECILKEDIEAVELAISSKFTPDTKLVIPDYRLRRPDGSLRWIAARAFPVLNEAGEVILVTGIAEDITDRKLAEEALRGSEERNRQILHTSTDGFCRIDFNDRLLEVNQAFCQMLGYEKHELLNMNIIDLVAKDTPQDVASHIQTVKNGGSGRFESRNRRKDGSLLDVEVSAQYMPGDHGGEFVAFVRDITDRHRAEKEKERLEANLRHAQKLQAVGTLASGVAHEFNNLLATIMGYSEIILNSEGNGQDHASNAAQILKASERGRDLVRKILSFTREAKQKAKPIDLNTEIRNSKEMLDHLFPRTVSIETRLAPDIDRVSMDASHLNQILMNLTTNASHAMPEGGKLVIKTENIFVESMTCSICGERHSGDYVLLSVSDTGQGMDTKTINRIYEPFFTTKDVGSGTGLGLSVVQGLVKKHDGHIACESQIGKGTTFKVFIPKLKSGEGDLAAEDHIQPAVAGGTETILLVDDEESIRNIAQQYLSEMGYRIRQAGSGEEALEIYRPAFDRIDLVVLDLGMAGMGGHKCLQEMLAINHQAKVVIASGYTTDGQDQQAMSAGATAFVAKPFKMAELLDTVRKVLDSEHDLSHEQQAIS